MPAKYKGYKEIVGLIAKRTMAGGMPLEGQVKVQMSFFQYVPKEMKKIDRYAAVYGGLRPTAKTGDIDNLVKTYTDAIIGICYKDDAQIVELNAGRWYAFNGKPSTLIRITRLD
jgi:Holliday junction resolvase RusA-like endonuclease